MDWSDDEKELQGQVKEAFSILGFDGFPKNEEQLKAFDEMFKDFPYKLNAKCIDPQEIIDSIEFQKDMEEDQPEDWRDLMLSKTINRS